MLITKLTLLMSLNNKVTDVAASPINRAGLLSGVRSSGGWECEHCHKVIPTERGLKIHKGLKHKATSTSVVVDQGSVECTVVGCGKRFRTVQGLKIHEGQMHQSLGLVSSVTVTRNIRNQANVSSLGGSAERQRCRRKWSAEEMRVLAELEYGHRGSATQGGAVAIAAELQKNGSDRTLRSVRAKLKERTYAAIREEVWSELGRGVDSSGDPQESSALPNEQGEPYEPTPVGGTNDGSILSTAASEIPLRERLVSLYRSYRKVGDGGFHEPLHEEALDAIGDKLAESISGDELYALVEEYFAGIVRPRPKRNPRTVSGPKGKRCQQRRYDYKMMQTNFRKNRSRTARELLSGRDGSGMQPHEVPGFFDHWSETYSPHENTCTDGIKPKGAEYDVWYEVSREEIHGALAGMKAGSSCGPDGVSVKELKAAPDRVLMKMMNLFVLLGRLPKCLKRSKTVFIPKKKSPQLPTDYRPISLSSVISRLFNKIMAKRLLCNVKLDFRQRGFLPIDGCAENIVILDEMIDKSTRGKKSLFVTMLDIKNAFGSVAHEAVIKALECSGACKAMVEYVKDLYTDYHTTLSSKGNEREVTVRRGILQGDCLSPMLFNMVMDHVLKQVPAAVGFSLSDEVRVNALAFADDLGITTESAVGMQMALSSVERAAEPLGLYFNATKCVSLAKIAVSTKRWSKVVCDSEMKFRIGGNTIPTVEDSDPVRYLGAYFNGRGLVNVPVEIDILLERLKRAPLKPQQKLYILRVHLIPKLIHNLVFADWTLKLLRRLDTRVRNFLVGKDGLLRLPLGSPSSFLYTPVAMGGLGLMSFRQSIPSMTLRRFERLKESKDVAVATAAKGTANEKRLTKAIKGLIRLEDILGDSREHIRSISRSEMVATMDGKALESAQWVSYTHRWISDGCVGSLSGKQYVDAVQLRINSLPTKSITGRGRTDNRTCRACKAVPYESNEHVMQSCPVFRGARMARHNRLCDVIKAGLVSEGYTVLQEHAFVINGRVHKPDLVAARNGLAVVLDAQVIGDNVVGDQAFQEKVTKYQSVRGLSDAVREAFEGRISGVEYGALIVSRRGIVSLKTDLLRESLGLSKAVMNRAVVSVLRGGLAIYGLFKGVLGGLPTTACYGAGGSAQQMG